MNVADLNGSNNPPIRQVFPPPAEAPHRRRPLLLWGYAYAYDRVEEIEEDLAADDEAADDEAADDESIVQARRSGVGPS